MAPPDGRLSGGGHIVSVLWVSTNQIEWFAECGPAVTSQTLTEVSTGTVLVTTGDI